MLQWQYISNVLNFAEIKSLYAIILTLGSSFHSRGRCWCQLTGGNQIRMFLVESHVYGMILNLPCVVMALLQIDLRATSSFYQQQQPPLDAIQHFGPVKFLKNTT